MEHIFQKGSNSKAFTFISLHGTGSNEEAMLPLAEAFNPDFNVLSIRGNVNENGMLRYFRRLAEGVYDIDDLNQRGDELLAFIVKAADENQFDIQKAVLLGFSNGSNIAINMLLKKDNPFKYAMLLAPMYPIEDIEVNQLEDLNVFISMGKIDPIVSLDDSEYVVSIFENRNAKVTESWTKGHNVSSQTIIDGRNWLNTIK